MVGTTKKMIWEKSNQMRHRKDSFIDLFTTVTAGTSYSSSQLPNYFPHESQPTTGGADALLESGRWKETTTNKSLESGSSTCKKGASKI